MNKFEIHIQLNGYMEKYEVDFGNKKHISVDGLNFINTPGQTIGVWDGHDRVANVYPEINRPQHDPNFYREI